MDHEIRVIRGVRITLASNVAAALAQTAIMAALARLVTAADYGLLAGAMVVLRLMQQLLVAGPERAALLLPDPGAVTWNAAFWALLGAGSAGAAMIVAGAGIAWGLGVSPAACLTLAALSPLVPIATTGVVFRTALRRHLAYGRLSAGDVAGQLLGSGAIAFIIAAEGWGLQALVAGQLAYGLLQNGVAAAFAVRADYIRIGGVPPGWRPLLRPLLTASLSITRTSFVEVVQGQLPVAIIGALLGRTPLGLQNRASALVQLPAELIVTSATRVRIGTFSLLREDAGLLKQTCLDLIATTGGALLPLCAGIAAAAPALTGTILGPDWQAAAPVVAWMAGGTALSMLGHVFASINEGMLRFEERFRIQMWSLAASALGLGIGGWLGGLEGALAGWASAGAVFLAQHMRLTAHCLSLPVRSMVRELLPAALVAAGCVVAVRAAALAEVAGGPVPHLLVDIALCAIVTMGLYALFFPRLFKMLLRHAGLDGKG